MAPFFANESARIRLSGLGNAVFAGAGPNTFWLTVTNVALGVLVGVCFLLIVLAVLCEGITRWKTRRSFNSELNHDMREMFAADRPPAAGTAADRALSEYRLLGPFCRIWRRLFHRP